jgi:hypothetical protein
VNLNVTNNAGLPNLQLPEHGARCHVIAVFPVAAVFQVFSVRAPNRQGIANAGGTGTNKCIGAPSTHSTAAWEEYSPTMLGLIIHWSRNLGQ